MAHPALAQLSVRHASTVVLSTVLLSVACSGESASLRVDLITDYAAADEFDTVHVEVEFDGEIIATRDHAVLPDGDYLAGLPIATIEDLKPRLYRVRVSLMLEGRSRITQLVVVDQPRGAFGLTVLVTRDCEGVRCPLDESPELTRCLGGECVDPRCTPTTPELCPAPECVSDEDCTPSVDCARATCTEGVCLETLDDGTCDTGEVCNRSFGCVPEDGGACGAALECELFEPSCLEGLSRRCALIGIDNRDDGRVHAAVYDPDTGASCSELATGTFPGVLSGAPQVFRERIVYASSSVDECALWSLSLDTGDSALESSPCGLPTLLDGALAWIQADGLGGGVIHVPGESDLPFSLAMNWGRVWAIGPSETALEQDGPWQVIDVRTAELGDLLTEPANAMGMWRDPSGGILWLVGSASAIEVVHIDSAGAEIARVPIVGLPELSAFGNFVGAGCAF